MLLRFLLVICLNVSILIVFAGSFCMAGGGSGGGGAGAGGAGQASGAGHGNIAGNGPGSGPGSQKKNSTGSPDYERNSQGFIPLSQIIKRKFSNRRSRFLDVRIVKRGKKVYYELTYIDLRGRVLKSRVPARR